MQLFSLKNDQLFVSEEKLFNCNDLSNFLFSEKIRAVRNAFPFFSETLQIILLKCRLFNLPTPELLRNNGQGLKRQMERLLVKNKLYKSPLLTIHFFRNNTNTDLYITVAPNDDSDLTLNTRGLLTDLFDKTDKSVSSLSSLSTGSQSLWDIANAHLRNTEADAFLLINSKGKIIESTGSMLLLIQGNRLCTADIDSSAYIDAAAPFIPAIAKQTNLLFEQKDGFTLEDLYNADELALFDAKYGVRWIVGFREKRYYNSKIRLLSDCLIQMISGQL